MHQSNVNLRENKAASKARVVKPVLDILIDELELEARQLRVKFGRRGATLVERVDEVGPPRERQRVRARHGTQ
jgi:hypothetical protein